MELHYNCNHLDRTSMKDVPSRMKPGKPAGALFNFCIRLFWSSNRFSSKGLFGGGLFLVTADAVPTSTELPNPIARFSNSLRPDTFAEPTFCCSSSPLAEFTHRTVADVVRAVKLGASQNPRDAIPPTHAANIRKSLKPIDSHPPFCAPKTSFSGILCLLKETHLGERWLNIDLWIGTQEEMAMHKFYTSWTSTLSSEPLVLHPAFCAPEPLTPTETKMEWQCTG